MRYQWKVVTLVAMLVAVTASILVWRTHAVVVADKLNFVADSSVKQIAPLKRLIDAKLGEAQNELVRFAASRAVNGPGRETNFGPFDVIALIQQLPAANGGGMAPAWTERGATAKADQWPYGHDLTLLKSLPYAKVKDGQRYWVRVADGKGAPVFALVVPVEVKATETPPPIPTQGSLPEAVGTNAPKPLGGKTRAYIVGFSSENPLAAITEDFIGSITHVYVVDDRGYVATHVDKSYNGALFTEDPMVAEIMKSHKAIGGGNFEDLESRPVIGHYEKVDDSNLTAIISVPTRAASVGSDEHLQTAIFTALGVTIVSAIAAWFAAGLLAPPTTSAPVIDLGSSGLPMAAMQEDDGPLETSYHPAPVVSVAAAAPTDASLQNERKLAYESFQGGLAKQMREPMLSILGHAQLIRSNTSSDDPIHAHVESIEREARNAKESLDRMAFVERAEVPLDPEETFDLDDVVSRTLEEKSVDLQASGVIVDRALGDVPRLKGRASDFSIALAHVIDNAIEAMRDRPVRRLTVKTENRGDAAALVITDTGVGMSRDVKNRAFEPFFKGFLSPMRMGLGLAFVDTVARRADAKCEIESVPGDGTTVTMKFPLANATVAVAAAVVEIEDKPEAFQVMKPAVPPPMARVERDAQIEENVKRLLTLGGRGPIDDGGVLPPMPYPKLDRESEPAPEEAHAPDRMPDLPLLIATEPPPTTTNEVEASLPEDSTVQINFAAFHATEPMPFPSPTEDSGSSSNISTGVDLGTSSGITPIPVPSEPESVASEPIATGEMPVVETSPPPLPDPIAAAPRPFRVRIRPPRTRGPNSQA